MTSVYIYILYFLLNNIKCWNLNFFFVNCLQICTTPCLAPTFLCWPCIFFQYSLSLSLSVVPLITSNFVATLYINYCNDFDIIATIFFFFFVINIFCCSESNQHTNNTSELRRGREAESVERVSCDLCWAATTMREKGKDERVIERVRKRSGQCCDGDEGERQRWKSD